MHGNVMIFQAKISSWIFLFLPSHFSSNCLGHLSPHPAPFGGRVHGSGVLEPGETWIQIPDSASLFFIGTRTNTIYMWHVWQLYIYILLYLAPERGLPSWFSTLYPFHLEEYHLQVYHSCRCPCSMYDNYSSSLSFLFMAWRCAWYREMQRENLDWSIESCLAYQIHVLPMTLWKGDWTTCNTTGNKHHLQPG